MIKFVLKENMNLDRIPCADHSVFIEYFEEVEMIKIQI